jgi:hypothetical protein
MLRLKNAGSSPQYANNERCGIQVRTAIVLTTPYGFSTESCCDHLTVNGVAYSGTQGPAGIVVEAGGTITWSSDQSITSSGWTVCADSSRPSSPQVGAVFAIRAASPGEACMTTSGGVCFTGTLSSFSLSLSLFLSLSLSRARVHPPRFVHARLVFLIDRLFCLTGCMPITDWLLTLSDFRWTR